MWSRIFKRTDPPRSAGPALYLFLLLVLSPLPLPLPAAENRLVLRVGVYANPPKIQLDARGDLTGILGDLLMEMAQRENWVIEPVSCQWSTCLDMLEEGRLDLLPDVAHNEERAERFDFHQRPALRSWSQLYSHTNSPLSSLLDLDGRRIAVLSGSVQQAYLENLADNFGLAVDWFAVNSFEQGFDATGEGIVDGVAANHYYGNARAAEMGLFASPVMFEPSQLYYASSQGRYPQVLNTIDGYLEDWISATDSPYYETLNRWAPGPEDSAPPWLLWWTLAGLGAALLLMTGFSQLLRHRVAQQTQELRRSEEHLNTILDSVDAYIYIKGTDLRYQYINRKMTGWLQRPANRILGKSDRDLFDERTANRIERTDQALLENGQRYADEEVNTLADSTERRTLLSVKIPLRDPEGRIYALCGISTDITEHRRIQDQLHRLAWFDPVTGLGNRRLLIDRLEHALAAHVRTGYHGALLLIDLDNFKAVNDTLGYGAGDALLRQVAERLQSHARGTDTTARLSADEFVMMLEDMSTDEHEAMMQAQRFAGMVMDHLAQPYELGQQTHVLTACAGIALFSDAGDNVNELLKSADLALTSAKSAGRNTQHFYNQDMQTEINWRSRLETALRAAIQNGEIYIDVQPQVDGQGRILGMEALARWNHHELGQVSPAQFIPVAEASGLIIPLGLCILEHACRLLSDWQRNRATQHLSLSINISVAQFRHPGFVDEVSRLIDQWKIVPDRLELEVTESLLISDLEQVSSRMQTLREQGIRFSLDDFGTGYASLGYLKRLPLYQLKIDQSFVRDLLTDPNDEAIVRTIIALGDSLDLTVIAEGVETRGQADRLEALGCQQYQGFLFGRPETPATWQPRLEGAR
ncbi:MAG: EAL domain-containing protein [Pseudohongiellaceae bacterium]